MKKLETNKIYRGNAKDVLKTFPDEFFDCVITSPPYWSLRDYGEETVSVWGGDENCRHEWGDKIPPKGHKSGKPGPNATVRARFVQDATRQGMGSDFCLKCGAWRGQLGLEPTLEMYLDHILQITAELKRVLKKTGTLFWNHGDSYGGSGNASGHTEETKNLGYKTSQMGATKGVTLGYLPKCLLMQNSRLVIRMVDEQGWILRNDIIWHKPNCMPSSARDRFTVDYEPVFFFTKSKKYWFEPQYERYDKPLNRWGGPKTKPTDKTKGDDFAVQERDGRERRPNKQGRNKRCVWKITTQPFKGAHFAVFPEALIEPMIKSGCPEFVCGKCGMAKEKIYKRTGYPDPENNVDDQGRRKSSGQIATDTGRRKVLSGARHAKFKAENPDEFIGYTNCGCNADFSGGTVLDPFVGSGTVAVVAKKLRRSWVAIELNPKYVKMAEKRTANAQGSLL